MYGVNGLNAFASLSGTTEVGHPATATVRCATHHVCCRRVLRIEHSSLHLDLVSHAAHGVDELLVEHVGQGLTKSPYR